MPKSLQFQFPGPVAGAAAKPRREIIGDHFCEVCGARASFGSGGSYLRNIPYRWRCFSHRMETQDNKGDAT